jgi:cytochrome c oxidase subunit 4
VFLALIVLTGATVAARYLPLGVAASIALALLIATVKGSLVAAYFMHLLDERPAIYALLLFTGAIAAIMLGLMLCSVDTGYEGMAPSPLQVTKSVTAGVD